MALPTIPILQRQLDPTLQLIISSAPTMTTKQILMIRLHLTEANILMGTSVSQENNATPNGNPEHALSTATAQGTTDNSSSSGNCGPSRRVSAAQRTASNSSASGSSSGPGPVHHPTTRSTTNRNAVIRSLVDMRPPRGASVPLIEVDSDDE